MPNSASNDSKESISISTNRFNKTNFWIKKTFGNNRIAIAVLLAVFITVAAFTGGALFIPPLGFLILSIIGFVSALMTGIVLATYATRINHETSALKGTMIGFGVVLSAGLALFSILFPMVGVVVCGITTTVAAAAAVNKAGYSIFDKNKILDPVPSNVTQGKEKMGHESLKSLSKNSSNETSLQNPIEPAPSITPLTPVNSVKNKSNPVPSNSDEIGPKNNMK